MREFSPPRTRARLEIPISDEYFYALTTDKSVVTRDVRSNKVKVLCVNFRDIPVRIKITQSQAVAIKDTNDSFIKALFPDFVDEWFDVGYRTDGDDVTEVVSYMRQKMEMRRDIMAMAFSSPASTLNTLKAEHLAAQKLSR